jgi:hypothetical protein
MKTQPPPKKANKYARLTDALPKSLLWGVAVLYLAAMFTGCATYKKKFTASTQANVGIFADHTLALLSEADLGLKNDYAVYVREFIDFDAPEEQRYIELKNRAAAYFDKIVRYSLKLVVITETYRDTDERVENYANFVSSFRKDVMSDIGFDAQRHKEIIAEIREQEKFMAALQKAQPIINAATQHLMQILAEMSDSRDVLMLKLDAAIDAEYADVIWYQEVLESEKYAILKGLGQLYRTYSGDSEAFERLKASGVIQYEQLIPQGTPKQEDLVAIKDHLMVRMQNLQMIEGQIEPDWKAYRAAITELDSLYKAHTARINRARLLSLMWMRAHQKMAAGIQSPAEWFDINDLPTHAFKLGMSAVF